MIDQDKAGMRSSAARRKADDRARVLVVDDDERNLLALTEVLGDIAEVVTADSGEAALRQLLRGDFAVILLDVFMPGIDGYETAQIIRAREQTKRIPIVFLSAVNKETEHLMRGYAMGAVDYVFKPVEPVVLRSKVAVFVDLFNMTREIKRKAEREQRLLDDNLKANAKRLGAERELRLAEQRQAAIIASLPIIFYLEPLDSEPRLPRYVSGNFAALTGYEFEQVQKNPEMWIEGLHPDDRTRVVDAFAKRSHDTGHAFEYRWRCADGAYKYFLDQAVVLRDAAGQAVEYAGTLLDVSDRRQLESQLVQSGRMEAVGQLTGGIAHDFNNLLAAVLGGIGLIERRVPLDAAHRRIIDMTRHAAEQGAELVGRLLAFSRRQKLDPGRIDIAELASSVTDLLTHTLGGLVTLEWQTEADLGYAFADAAQLELALMNLIINARDSMPDGGIIRVIGRNAEVGPGKRLGGIDLPAGRYVVLTVADSGCGIPPELIKQVTEPFFTTKEVGKGTGLGLSMVYGFASQSGGAIHIESRSGVGTEVALWLPRASEAAAAGTGLPRPMSSAAVAADVPRLRLLLVDDHEGVRMTTATLLKDFGHHVVEAADGNEALKRLRAGSDEFDCIVSDYAMPQMSGTEVVSQARAIRKGMPAIMITGYADQGSISQLPTNVPVLIKPFTPEHLQQAIAEAVARDSEQAA